MNLTTVINCYNDPRVFRCVESITGDTEVIVVLAGGAAIERELLLRKIRVVPSEPGNYSRNCNLGVHHASRDNVLIVDSDCTLAPCCLERVCSALRHDRIVRCRVEFLCDEHIWLSDVIARLRDSINNAQPIRAYTPGLAFRRSVVAELGGYLFDEDVSWASDSELSRRVKGAGVAIRYDPEAVLYHEPISVGHEIRSGFRLGRGQRMIVEKGLRPGYESPRQLLGKLLSGQALANYRQTARQCGRRAVLVSLAWDLAFYTGYYRQALNRLRSGEPPRWDVH